MQNEMMIMVGILTKDSSKEEESISAILIY